MSAVGLVAHQRLARHWRSLVVAGVLLGIGFGLCFASLAAARRTSSAYDRILTHADAPDAAVSLSAGPEAGQRALHAIHGITRQRVFAGFIGSADGIPRALTTALLAPTRDAFPLELPTMHAGRLPRPNAPDEVFVNTDTAARAGLRVGDRVRFRLLQVGSAGEVVPDTERAVVTIVGIGTLPSEAAADETSVVGLWVFSRAFYDEHRAVVAYAASNVDLASGFDARRDLAPAVGKLGDTLQSARTQERHLTNGALHPMLIVLVAIAVLAFGAATVAAAQVVQRNRERWLVDSDRLRILGMARAEMRAVELATSAVVAAVAVVIAVALMLAASPIAPIGALHSLDPAQGVNLDVTMALAGAAAIVVTLALLTLAFSAVHRRAPRPALHHSPAVAQIPSGVAASAGLTLALRADDGRGRGWRGITATALATALLALCTVFVASAAALTDTPSHYGFDANVLAVNPYGDQSPAELTRAFARRDDVVAATGFTSGSYLVDGRAVPGLAASHVKSEVTPTILRGRAPRTAHEIVVGADTLDLIKRHVGDEVGVQLLVGGSSSEAAASASASAPAPAQDPIDLRIVGVATFPAVAQVGTDMPRLGTGALVTRDAYLRMGGDARNEPEFTAVRLARSTDAARVIADNPAGIQDALGTATSWFTDAKPAEVRQLDAAMPYLRGALLVGYAILLAVIVHALWAIVRANRHDLAVLRVLGCTRGQLDAVASWQVAPVVGAALVLGVPLGLAVGRLAFARFADSLAVVDDVSISFSALALLVAAVLLAAAVAVVVAAAMTRRARAAVVLRAG
jgi:hypothetical protein